MKLKSIKITFDDTYGPEYYVVRGNLSDARACERAIQLYEDLLYEDFTALYPTPYARTIISAEVI